MCLPSMRLLVLLWVDRLHLVAQCWPPTALLLCSELQFEELYCDSLNHAEGHWEGMGSAGRGESVFPPFIMLRLTSWEWWQCCVTEILQAGIGVPYGAGRMN